LLSVREPRYGDRVMVATSVRRYGMLYGTVCGDHTYQDTGQTVFAVILDAPLHNGVCLLIPVPALRLVVIP
jgi:hypothetical protein